MSGHKITSDIDRAFLLIGIATTLHDYKLCYELQSCIDCDFARVEDGIIELRERDAPLRFPVFRAYQELTGETFILFGNKVPGGILLPEAERFDYLLKVTGQHAHAKEMTRTIKALTGILTAAIISVKTLKLPDRLIYEEADSNLPEIYKKEY